MLLIRTAVIATLALVSVCTGLTAQQLSASFDSLRLEIGSTTFLRITFKNPAGVPIPQCHTDELRALPALELLSETPLQKTAHGWEQSFQIIAFRAGTFDVPAPVVEWNGSLYRTAPLRLEVVSPALPADGSPAPIKDIMEEPRNFSDSFPFVIAFAAAIVLILALWRFLMRRKKAVAQQPEPEPAPQDQARKRLLELQQSRLWHSDYQQFYIRLSDTLRWYIERRFAVQAPTETTGDILRNLKSAHLDDALLQSLEEVLTTSDYVKFAQAVPDSETNTRLLQTALHWVEKTAAP